MEVRIIMLILTINYSVAQESTLMNEVCNIDVKSILDSTNSL